LHGPENSRFSDKPCSQKATQNVVWFRFTFVLKNSNTTDRFSPISGKFQAESFAFFWPAIAFEVAINVRNSGFHG
jgi:hypothetical protein